MTNLERHQARKRRRKALNVVFKELEGQTDNWGKHDIRDQLIETLNDTMHVVIHETKDEYHRKDMKELLHRLGQLRDIVALC